MTDEIAELISKIELSIEDATRALGKLEEVYNDIKGRLERLRNMASEFENAPERTPVEVEEFAMQVIQVLDE